MTSSGVTTSFTYDAWGRMAQKNATIGGTPRTAYYSYSFGDKLKVVSTNFPGETTTAYNYDGLGKRRNRITDFGGGNPELTWWRWDLGWSPLCEYADPDADWEIEGFAQFNVYNGLMHPLAEAAVSGSPANAAYSYLALDHLSSTRVVYNQAKTATASLEFYPYGEPLTATGALPDARFTAKPYDPETGLYYFPYRYYSPAASRWIGADPLGLIDGPNFYGYVNNDPIRKTDPYGLTSWCDALGYSFVTCDIGYASCRAGCLGLGFAGGVVCGTMKTIADTTCNVVERGPKRDLCRAIRDLMDKLCSDSCDFLYDSCEKGCEVMFGLPWNPDRNISLEDIVIHIESNFP